jgi:hypothetical protein
MTTLSLCSALGTDLPDRQFGPEFVRNQIQQLRRSIRGLEREGLRHVFVLSRGWRKCQCLKMGQNSGRNGGGAFLCCSERDDSALLLLLPLRPTCFLGCSNSRKPSRRHPTFSADRDRCFRASRSGSPRALKLEAKYDAFALSCLQAMVRGGLIRGRPRRDRVLVWALHLRNSHHVLPAPRHW